jgi:hypothetical protein
MFFVFMDVSNLNYRILKMGVNYPNRCFVSKNLQHLSNVQLCFNVFVSEVV